MTLRRGDRLPVDAAACAFAPGRPASSTARSASGTLDLPLRLPARAGARHPDLQVHRHRPAHAGQDAARPPLRATPPELAHAIADVLAEQVRHLDADVVQIDEANLPGHPEEWEWAASAINRVLDAVPDDAGGAPVLRQLRRPERAEGHLGAADALPERAARRPRGARVRAPAARGARGVQGPASPRSASASASSTSRRPRSRSADAVARAIERAETAARRRPGEATSTPTAASGC